MRVRALGKAAQRIGGQRGCAAHSPAITCASNRARTACSAMAMGTHIGAVAARSRPSLHKELAQPIQGHLFRLRRPLLLLLLLFPLVHHDIAGEPCHLCLVARHFHICRAVARNAFRVRHVAALPRIAELRTKSPVARAPGACRTCGNGSGDPPPQKTPVSQQPQVDRIFFLLECLNAAPPRCCSRHYRASPARSRTRGTQPTR